MKQKVKILLVLSMVFLLTGCIRFNATMDIKMDKSMDYTIIYAFDKNFLEKENATVLTTEQMKELESQGYKLEVYEKDNLEGYKISKTFKNIDEISTEDEQEYELAGLTDEGAENQYIFQVKKGLLKNRYKAKFKFDTNNSNISGNSSSTEFDWEDSSDWNYDDENNTVSYKQLDGDELTVVGEEDNTIQKKEAEEDYDISSLLANNLDLKFNVNLPTPALSHNATESEDDNKKLSWTLTTKQEEIAFEFELYNLPVVIGIGVVALLVVIGVISTIISSVGKGKNKPIPVMPQNGNVMNSNVMNNQNNNNVVANQEMSNQIPQNNQMMTNNQMPQNNQVNNNIMSQQDQSINNNSSFNPNDMSNQNTNAQTDNRGIDPMDMPNGMNQAPFSIPEPTPSNGSTQQPQMNYSGGESAFNIPDPVQSNLNK